ncbi:MAG: DUF1573 domain-containing protein [Bacteroidota bacterium]
MKKKTFQLLAVVGAFLLTSSAIAQSEAVTADTPLQTEAGSRIVFAEDAFDFGDIAQGDRVEHVFEFENAGNQPLILSNVLTTCGCTASEWPREPIAPGVSASIKVTFNSAGKMGVQNKVVTIVSNAINSRERVRITTNVLPKQEGS